ncbi:hypothetical protein Tco_0744706 [Tanacetum coccineum]
MESSHYLSLRRCSREAVAGVQQSKVSRVSSYPSIVVGDQTFFGIGEGDNVRVSTLAGRSSKNPNHAFPSSITNPEVGSFAAKIGELVRDVVDGVASNDCITSMNGDVIIELFGNQLRKVPGRFMNTIWSIWNTLVVETPIETNANPMPSKVSADPIVQSVSIEKPSSYVGAAVGSETETRRSSFTRCLIEIDAKDVLKESLTMGVPLIEGTGYTIETVTIEYEWNPLDVTYKTNDGFQTVGKKKKKGKSKSTNGGQFVGPSVKTKYSTTGTSSEKGKFTTSNSYSALDDESEEDVENVYDELANLFPNSKTGGSSSFKAAAG